ncbi:MAG TPA: hypothetical protein PKD90_12830 [Phnomibacter sp.]|nr:hypothetical protein [Phnomibacter sp.]
MLENLLELVKQYGQEQVVDNTEIPNEQNEAVMAEASYAVAGTLQEALASGQMEDVLKMFSTGSSAQIMANPVAQNMQSGFVDSITSKLGINKNVAIGLAATLIPIVVSKMVKRTRSDAPEDSGFDLSGLIGSLTGGSGGGLNIGSLIGQLTGGGGQQGGGGFDIANIIQQVTSGAQQSRQSGGGGLADLISGFFGNR